MDRIKKNNEFKIKLEKNVDKKIICSSQIEGHPRGNGPSLLL